MKRNQRIGVAVACVLCIMLVVTGCSKKVVSRIDPSETVDLSGKWNDTDSRLVAEEVGTFLRDIERAMVNSGQVQVVASAEERGEIRDEREDQRINATPETLKQMGREIGADFMLIGEINQINDREGKEEVRYYQTDLTLVNIETNVKTWLGQKKIKKYIGRSSYSP